MIRSKKKVTVNLTEPNKKEILEIVGIGYRRLKIVDQQGNFVGKVMVLDYQLQFTREGSRFPIGNGESIELSLAEFNSKYSKKTFEQLEVDLEKIILDEIFEIVKDKDYFGLKKTDFVIED